MALCVLKTTGTRASLEAFERLYRPTKCQQVSSVLAVTASPLLVDTPVSVNYPEFGITRVPRLRNSISTLYGAVRSRMRISRIE
jgi:hypothetical protein